MGRGKRKDKLQLKNSNDDKSDNFSNIVENKKVINEMRSDSLESIFNNPSLLNHINDIQNIDENILVWNNEDAMDVQGNENLHGRINNEAIKKSMKNSPFSKYLNSHIRNINNINNSALGGVIMINYKHMPQTEKSKNTLNKMPCNNFDLVASKKPLETVNRIDQNLPIENIESSEETSPHKSDLSKQSQSSPTQAVRRSGRSAKVNYLDMINIPIFEMKKSFESDAISPTKKSKNRINQSKAHIRLSSNENMELETGKQLRKAVQTSEKISNFDIAIFADILANDGTDKSGELQTDDEVAMEMETSHQIFKEAAEDERTKEKSPEENKSMIAEEKKIELMQKHTEESHEEKIKPETLEEQTQETREEDGLSMAEHDREERHVEIDECDMDGGDTSTKKRPVKRSKSKKSTVKIVEISCLGCKKQAYPNKLCENLCRSCYCIVKKLVTRSPTIHHFVCICQSPCWSRNQPHDSDENRLCDACNIQHWIEMGLKWGSDFKHLDAVTVGQLRSRESVDQARLAWGIEAQSILDAIKGAATDAGCNSCLLPLLEDGKKEQAVACKWDVRVFSRIQSNVSESSCELCGRSDMGAMYEILPNRSHRACHQCLLLAFRTINNNNVPQISNNTDQTCHDRCCTPVSQCAQCLLARIESLCGSVEVVKYRFMDDSDNMAIVCGLCRQQDISMISVLRSGHFVCLVCVWRIKLHFVKNSPHCPSFGVCSIGDCSSCLTELASRIIPSLDYIISHVHDPFQKLPKKHIKRHHDQNDTSESKSKRPCVSNPLVINANWTTPNATGDSRARRVIKQSQFSDFIVDKKCLIRPTNDRQVQLAITNHTKNVQLRLTEHINRKKKDGQLSILDTTVDDSHAQPVDNDGLTNGIVEESTDNVDKQGDLSHANHHDDSIDHHNGVVNESAVKETEPETGELIEDRDQQEGSECTLKASRRIKQAVTAPAASLVSIDSPTISTARASGPRVKQVSRLNVNADLNLDSVRQKCVVKRVNRANKKPTNLNNVPHADNSDHLDQLAEDDNLADESDIAQSSQTTKCGICSGCTRNRSCGKCDSCLLNKSQRRKTEMCLKMMCITIDNDDDNEQRGQASADKISNIRKLDSSQRDQSTDNADRSVDEILPTKSQTKVATAVDQFAEVYRDSDSDDLSSEEEQLDPDLDVIHTVKGDMITTGLAHEGGYPVITSFKAQPNKVMCFSCGSGGDQMIHCVSCAEPFHFFCIEFQFRPKCKEMFVCRNCTKCHTCEGYGSDLKCIKCQLGFHPSCVDKYPPSRSEDKSNWACYKCAMCLHCGAKAEDAMRHVSKNNGLIDWSKDPWQCGRCARARKDGQVCPECGRAYQSGLETIECCRCARMIHRQCSGLSEDEYEILKCDPESASEANNFTCSKCSPVPSKDKMEHEEGEAAEEDAQQDEQPQLEQDQVKKRVRLKRQCKESNLKVYCERGVIKRVNDYIQKGETHEEMLLEQYQLSDTANVKSASLNQTDGADDDDVDVVAHDDNCTNTTTAVTDHPAMVDKSPIVDNGGDRDHDMPHASSTICNSSESIGEYDMEQLSALDADQQSKADMSVDIDSVVTSAAHKTKTGIFSRLTAADFLSPKHMLMEALARISIKLSRYPPHSPIFALYNTLLLYLQDISEQIFPWIDFKCCLDYVQKVCKKNSGRIKLVLQAIYDNIKDSKAREFDVFSSSIWEIEEKLNISFQKGREEFIIFHSEQHLQALMKHLESRTTENIQFNNYRLAFETADQNNTICEKDVRNCALCGYSGDDGLEGRLLYGGLDVWVHVNCALWSDEVYEKEDGALMNVESAIKRGETTICSSCNNFGATIRCSAEESLDGYGDCCLNVYHFGCAFNLLTDPVFTESRTFFCSEMHEAQMKDEQQLGLADMLILRRIYLPQGCLGNVSMACPNGLPSDQIVVTIGNLRIDSLGKIESCSDLQKVFLSPVGFKARRLYWSMTELDSLVMYYMTVKKELNKNTPCDEPPLRASTTSLIVSTAVARRRRMIETSDSRIVKRSKLMECTQKDTIYEMDDDGNLRPTAGSTVKNMPREFLKFHVPCSSLEMKVNRRFPMNKVQIARESKMESNQIQSTESRELTQSVHTDTTPVSSSTAVFNKATSSSATTIVHSSPILTFVPQMDARQTALQRQFFNNLTQRKLSQLSNCRPSVLLGQHAMKFGQPFKSTLTKLSHTPQRFHPTSLNPMKIVRHSTKPHTLVNEPRSLTSAEILKGNFPKCVPNIDGIKRFPKYHTNAAISKETFSRIVPAITATKVPVIANTPVSEGTAVPPRFDMPFQRGIAPRQFKPTPRMASAPPRMRKYDRTVAISPMIMQTQVSHPVSNSWSSMGNIAPRPVSSTTSISLMNAPHTVPNVLLTTRNVPQSVSNRSISIINVPRQAANTQMDMSMAPRSVPVTSVANVCRSFSTTPISITTVPRPSVNHSITSIKTAAQTSTSSAQPVNTSRKSISSLPDVLHRAQSAKCISTNPQRIYKIMKPTSSNIPNRKTTLTEAESKICQQSVLRTVLTDNVLHFPKRTQPSSEATSTYIISSCGSLSNVQHAPMQQYDGEIDSVGSVASDQENMSAVVKSKSSKARSNQFCLRFVIHGFKGSKSPRSAWTYLVRRVSQLRKAQGLTEYTLRTGDGWAKFGIEHRHVIYLVEQMAGAFQCYNYEFKFHKNRVNKLREQYSPDVPTTHGCARFSPWFKLKPDHIARDPLAFLQCKSNHPPKNHAPENVDKVEDNPEPDNDYLQNLATQFRNLHNGAQCREKNVRVCCSIIHGRGLFARRKFEAHEIIIEYVGEVIRSILSDVRETEYQKTGVDCYMFRLDQDLIVDATFKGNAARFINHSCHPNCYAKVVRFEGEKHIIIIAQRKIHKGEELTYDYRFPIEDDKLPCTCGSFSCRKYLN